MHQPNVRYRAALALFILAGSGPMAAGQNAVGDGRALERPLMNNPTGIPVLPGSRGFTSELMFRESIVSGTAPAGLSFRGESLPSRFEFRGELGEDVLFAFRRDSLYSGLAGRGIRGTEALQYQFSLTTGGRIPSNLGGQLSYARAGEFERGGDPQEPLRRDMGVHGQGPYRVEDAEQMMPAIQVGSSLIQPVRSVSSYVADRSMQPTLVGVMQNRNTQQTAGQTASPLTGVQIVPIDLLRAPVQPDLSVPTSEPLRGNFDTAPRLTTAFDDLMMRFRDLTEAESAEESGVEQEPADGRTVPKWAEDISSIRDLLRGLPPSTARAMGLEPRPEGEETPELVSPLDPDAPREVLPTETADPETFSKDVLRRIRQAGVMTDTLIATDQPQVNRYAAYMQGAQDMLARERYFDAEERFISALTAKPNDVNASVGRIHAQIGGGLFLSAGLNLRQLLVTHPQVAGMRYGTSLLPGPERIEELQGMLRQALDSSTSGADEGLLLAYLGFQTDTTEDIVRGLGALAERGDEADARLAELLRGVWLISAEEAAPDAEPPAAEEPSPASDGG